MSARRLALVAAACVLTASEVALWLHSLELARAQAELRGRMLAHRCQVIPVVAPTELGLLGSDMPAFPRLEPGPLTDPALTTPEVQQ